MRPADDVESLADSLRTWSRGSLPWQHFKSDDEITAMKRELLIGDLWRRRHQRSQKAERGRQKRHGRKSARGAVGGGAEMRGRPTSRHMAALGHRL